MSTYNGHALVLGDDDTEIPVTANLTSYRDGFHTGWRGPFAPSATVSAEC